MRACDPFRHSSDETGPSGQSKQTPEILGFEATAPSPLRTDLLEIELRSPDDASTAPIPAFATHVGAPDRAPLRQSAVSLAIAEADEDRVLGAGAEASVAAPQTASPNIIMVILGGIAFEHWNSQRGLRPCLRR